MKVTKLSNGFELITDTNKSDVKVEVANRGDTILTVGDRQTKFDHTSRVSRGVSLHGPEKFAKHFHDGKFFYKDDELVDFRYGTQKTFVHTPSAIQKLIEVVGYADSTSNSRQLRSLRNKQVTQTRSSVILGSNHSSFDVVPSELGEANKVKTHLNFVWSPFSTVLNSAVDVIRLVCANGMVGVSSLFNNKVPVVNNWEYHIDVAAKLIANKTTSILEQRLNVVNKIPVSVGDVMVVFRAIKDTLNDTMITLTREERDMLVVNLMFLHEVLERSGVDKLDTGGPLYQLNTPLSAFGLINVATEVSTHVGSMSNTTINTLQKLSNMLLLDKTEKNTLFGKCINHTDTETSMNGVDFAFTSDKLLAA